MFRILNEKYIIDTVILAFFFQRTCPSGIRW